MGGVDRVQLVVIFDLGAIDIAKRVRRIKRGIGLVVGAVLAQPVVAVTLLGHNAAVAAASNINLFLVDPFLLGKYGDGTRLGNLDLGTLYQKRFCPSFDLRTGSVIQFLPCLAVTALVAWRTETMVVHWTPAFLFALGWLVLVLSLGAVSLLNVLIRSGSAVNVASLFYLTPPTTALIAWAMFGETLTGLALAGMALAVLGVWLARR